MASTIYQLARSIEGYGAPHELVVELMDGVFQDTLADVVRAVENTGEVERIVGMIVGELDDWNYERSAMWEVAPLMLLPPNTELI